MSQVTFEGVEPILLDPHEIGWYIESADEEVYGPVSRKTLGRFLEDGTISPNTLVRHCTQAEAMPAADQPALTEQLGLVAKGSVVGDRLAEAWPRRKRDQLALAGDSIPCAWHRAPAVLVCIRCHAPYCPKCRAKPYRKQFFLCRRCQAGFHNRRFLALMVDVIVLVYIPAIALGVALAATGPTEGNTGLLISGLFNVLLFFLIFGRDALFGGAGIGKRLFGLRVVKTKDGTSPISYGQGVVRWLSQYIPIFNLLDAIAPYSDPLLRRYGDRWAGTRVIDTDRKLEKVRGKIAWRLFKKKVQLPREFGMTMQDLARLA